MLNKTFDDRYLTDEEIKHKRRSAELSKPKFDKILMKKNCACGRKCIVKRERHGDTATPTCTLCKQIGLEKSKAEFERLQTSGRSELNGGLN